MPSQKNRDYLIGQKFNMLTVKYRVYRNKREYLSCICDCGVDTLKRLDGVVSSHCKSCGCLNRAQIDKAIRTHGKSYTPEYSSWKSMKQRCYNKNNKKYHIYGGKGIKVYDDWVNSFENFLKDMGSRTLDQSLDRIDPNGNYEPTNCRWISKSENSSRGTINRNLIHGNPFKKGRPK